MRWGRSDTRRVTLIQDFLADLRYAGRVFTKSRRSRRPVRSMRRMSR
jgi:hypothetical protein